MTLTLPRCRLMKVFNPSFIVHRRDASATSMPNDDILRPILWDVLPPSNTPPPTHTHTHFYSAAITNIMMPYEGSFARALSREAD